VLSDKEIAELVDTRKITGVQENVPRLTSESPIQAASLDLHIGNIYLPSASADGAGGENKPLSEHLLSTGETVLVGTLERLNLPPDIGGIAFPPSRFAVKALLVTNAGHVDPEYRGPMRFTIINMGHEAQKLQTGDRVGTLMLFRASKGAEKGWFSRTGYEGRLPTTQDLRYLSKDFAEVGTRAERIAKEKVREATISAALLAAILTFVAAIIIGIGSLYSPVAKLETKVDLYQEQSTKAQDIEKRLQKLEGDAKATADVAETVRSLEKRTAALEKKVK
jgi:deoxycytidine triphosphate deaminase